MKDRYVLKLCITGSNTNLNCHLVRNTAEGAFSANYMPIIGVDITTKVITVHDQEVKLILHTTAGQGYFGKLRQFYYEGSVSNIIIFDKGDPASFAVIPYYYQEYRRIQGPEKPVLILGIISDSEEVTAEQGQQLADDLNCLYFESHPSDKNTLLDVYISLVKLDLEKLESIPTKISRLKVPCIAHSNITIVKALLQAEYLHSKTTTFTRDDVLDLWVQNERRIGNQKAEFYLRNRLLRPRLSSVINSLQRVSHPHLSVLYKRSKRGKRGRLKALLVFNL